MSPYILFEIALALRSRKLLLVFVDNRLPSGILPPRVLQLRYSHVRYYDQIPEQTQVLRLLESYMGDLPVPRYQPSTSQQSCGVVGLSALSTSRGEELSQLINSRGYRPVLLDEIGFKNPLEFDQFEQLATLGLVLLCTDVPTERSNYWAGAVCAASLPKIEFTLSPNYPIDPSFPEVS